MAKGTLLDHVIRDDVSVVLVRSTCMIIGNSIIDFVNSPPREVACKMVGSP